jgi:ABC-type nitrate/sulfonate/bicarbonate transport system permease component
VRPRTKEFLVGYPFLFLTAFYYLKGRREWLWLLAAIGGVAPISVFNTFSHIHTPVMISLTRTLNGLVLGIVIALLVGWLVERFFARSEAKD